VVEILSRVLYSLTFCAPPIIQHQTFQSYGSRYVELLMVNVEEPDWLHDVLALAPSPTSHLSPSTSTFTLP
jgi:hypothetical protein